MTRDTLIHCILIVVSAAAWIRAGYAERLARKAGMIAIDVGDDVCELARHGAGLGGRVAKIETGRDVLEMAAKHREN